MQLSTRRLALCGMMVALAAVCSYVEAMVPISIGVPGIKLGLANLIIVLALYQLGAVDALIINLLRILLVSLLFGGFSAAMYSLAGGMLSWAIMVLLKNINRFSVVGVSMAGGVVHNIGQLLLAAIVVNTPQIMLYAGILVPVGMITGILIGFMAAMVLKQIGSRLRV